MSFAWPAALWLTLLPAAWLAAAWRRRDGPAGATQPHLLAADAGPDRVTLTGGPAARRPRFLLGAGLVLALVALARPQWGRVDEPVFNQSREILIGLDLSRSMLTPDVKPSRLDRSQLLIRSLLDHLAGERVGLVVFAGTAFLQAPMSTDYEIIREFLPHLGPDFLPVGGTDYAALIATATDAFDSGDADRYLILLSDGGATDPGWRAHIPELTAKNIHVIALGVGTEAGGFIPDGAGGFLKDRRGAVVLARLEADSLQELAANTGGVYRDASDWVDLPQLLRSTVEAGRKGGFSEHETVRQVERFQWALAPALVLLLLSYWREFPVRPRARVIRRRVAAAGLLAAGVLTVVRAAATAPPSASAGQLLARIANRLANGPASPTAADWAEFAEQTRSWGERLQEAKQAVPEGPVRDGLAAVDAGRALDGRAVDWNRLAAELMALLKPPPPPPPPPPPQPDQSQSNAPSPQDAPPPPSEQPVGGENPNVDRSSDPARANPALSSPIQKLDEVRNADSPATLFEMIEKKNPHPHLPPTGGENW